MSLFAILAGLATGLVLGLFGSGGSIIALPALLFCVAIIIGGSAAWVFGVLAAASAVAGLLVERWLIFAEATHTVALYYPTQR